MSNKPHPYNSVPFGLQLPKLILVLSTVLILMSCARNSPAQIAIPLSELNPQLFANIAGPQVEITVSGDRLFVCSEQSFMIFDKDGKAIQVETVKGRECRVETAGGLFFVATTEGFWIIDRQGKAIKLNIEVFEMKAIIDRIFVQDHSSLIVRSDGQTIDVGIKEHANRIKVGSDLLFVYTEQSLWSVDRNGVSNLIEGLHGRIHGFETMGPLLFVGTSEGLWVSKDGKSATPIKDVNGNVYGLVGASRELLVSTNTDLHLVNLDGTIVIVRNAPKHQWGIPVAFEDRFFVRSRDGLWIVNPEGSAIQVDGIRQEDLTGPSTLGHTLKIEGFENQFAVATDQGLWLISQDYKAIKLNEVKGNNPELRVMDRQLFVGTDQGFWVMNTVGGITRLDSVKGQVESIDTLGQYLYVHTSENVYQLHPHAKIVSKLVPSGWWSRVLSLLLPSTWLPTGNVRASSSYTDEIEQNPYNATLRREFRYAKANDNSPPGDDQFSPEEQFTFEIGLATNNVHYWVKDKWGNALECKARYKGVPSQYALMGAPFILTAIFVLGCFALAPKVKFCHSAIMNPWLRKYFSLGSIPLLLSVFPSLRRYVLSRYATNINEKSEFADWKDRFVYPDEAFLPERFGPKLESERRLVLTGRSGIGKTSFFKHLTAHYAADTKGLSKKCIPVYVSLTNYGGNSLEDLIFAQLFSYGDVTDKDLAPMFLEQGGLIIFLDGVNEVQNVADRQRLRVFVEKFWMTNYFCLSSQQTYPEIENIPRVELKTFSRERICDFLRQRVNEAEKTTRVIKELTDEQCQVYCVPRDLEFAVEILNSGGDSLPKTRTDLYRTVFMSIFAQWRDSGNIQAEGDLCQRAYTMIAERELVFDSVDSPRFREITTDLFNQRFLIRREQSYNFRHDLIRSYLASEYFYPRWFVLLEQVPNAQIDSNWLEMLKFASEKINDSSELMSLVYKVLEKSVRKDLVRSLFEWVKTNYPEKCDSWQGEFYAKYGEMDFKNLGR